MLLAWLASWAMARDLSLDEALATALTGPAAREAGLRLDQTRAGLTTAEGAWDPVLSASADASTSRSRGFLAGTPTSSDATAAAGSVGLVQALPTGTTVQATTSLRRDVMVSSSTLTGDQTQRNWTAAAKLTVTQDLLAPLRRSTARSSELAAREALDQATLTERAAASDAIGAAARAWWAWWAATDEAELADLAERDAVALEERTRAWVEAGRLARLELDRVTAERLAAQRDRLAADAEVRATRDDLLVLLGEPLGQDVRPAGAGRAWVLDDADEDALVADVLARNPELLLARAEIDAQRRVLADTRASRLPTLDLTGAVGVGSLSEEASDAVTDLWGEDALPEASVGLDLSVPLGGRAARGRVRSAEAALSALEVSEQTAMARAEADARASVDAVRTAGLGLDLARARLEVARSTEVGERLRVEEGAARLDEWLDATRDRISAEADVRTAEVALASAELDLAALRDRVWEDPDVG
ncbi:MAG: TolC family protein [Alphaproteobacteria bacterium]|nr:TolC family protein [Alphaproteobacteria bacterium]